MPPEPGFVAVVLGARPAGAADALAEQASVPNKSLVPIAGRPLVRHVADTLAGVPGLVALRVVVEAESFAPVRAALAGLDAPLELVAAADNLADSVYRAAAPAGRHAVVVTTADNVLLTPAAVLAVLEPLRGGADVAVALASEQAVLAAHPRGQRRFYRFSDMSVSNCNLYAFAGERALAAVESFRSGGQFAKKPRRLLAAVGPVNLLLFRFGRLSLGRAFARLSRRLGLRLQPVILADGSQAIDVDNRRTYDAALDILRRREGAAAQAA